MYTIYTYISSCKQLAISLLYVDFKGCHLREKNLNTKPASLWDLWFSWRSRSNQYSPKHSDFPGHRLFFFLHKRFLSKERLQATHFHNPRVSWICAHTLTHSWAILFPVTTSPAVQEFIWLRIVCVLCVCVYVCERERERKRERERERVVSVWCLCVCVVCVWLCVVLCVCVCVCGVVCVCVCMLSTLLQKYLPWLFNGALRKEQKMWPLSIV